MVLRQRRIQPGLFDSVDKAIRLFLRIQSGALRSITTGTLIVTRFHPAQCSYIKIGLALVTV
jgi:hypothetical protein